MPAIRLGTALRLVTIKGGQALAHAPRQRTFPPARFSTFQ
jgi:hypothetical protein